MKITVELTDMEMIEFLNWRKQTSDVAKVETCVATPVSLLFLTHRTENCLKGEEICTIEAIEQMRDKDLLKIPNFGRLSLRELRDEIQRFRDSQVHCNPATFP